MSEQKKVTTEETVETEATEKAKKPVAKAKVKETEKENWFKRKIVKPIKDNKKVILAGLGGVAAGAGGTLAYGYFSSKRAEKRRQQELAYIPQEETNPLDPNV